MPATVDRGAVYAEYRSLRLSWPGKICPARSRQRPARTVRIACLLINHAQRQESGTAVRRWEEGGRRLEGCRCFRIPLLCAIGLAAQQVDLAFKRSQFAKTLETIQGLLSHAQFQVSGGLSEAMCNSAQLIQIEGHGSALPCVPAGGGDRVSNWPPRQPPPPIGCKPHAVGSVVFHDRTQITFAQGLTSQHR